MKSAAFFDRDGMLNMDTHFLYIKEEFQWIDGAIDEILWANESDYYVFAVMNCASFARE